MGRLKVNCKAVIFDMDGVIIDSMPYHFIAWYETLIPLGIRVSCFDVYSKEGENWEKTLKYFLKKAKIKISPSILEGIFLRRKVIFRRYFKRFVFKGIYELLVRLERENFLLGLVTGTPMPELRRILPKNIYKFFDCIVAGDHVKKGKPHPEPYLKAASRLAVKPDQCAVVENAPFGIDSAKSAGMFCFALTSGLPREYLKKADIIVDKFDEIGKMLNRNSAIRPKVRDTF